MNLTYIAKEKRKISFNFVNDYFPLFEVRK